MKVFIRLAVAYFVIYGCFFILFQPKTNNIGLFLFLVLSLLILSIVNSFLIMIIKLLVSKIKRVNYRMQYLLCYLILYFINFLYLLIEGNVGFDFSVNSVFISGYFGVTSMITALLILTPLYNWLLAVRNR